MKRFDLINFLIERYKYQSYLEIGLDGSKCYSQVKCHSKMSVDPKKGATKKGKHYRMRSNDFFEQNKYTYDIIFVDGLHTYPQSLADVNNSLKILNAGGVVVTHDCNPKSAAAAQEDKTCGTWNGTVWQAYAHLRATREDLNMHVVNIDHGCGVIHRGKQKLYTGPYETYGDLVEHRNDILKLISFEQLEKMHG